MKVARRILFLFSLIFQFVPAFPQNSKVREAFSLIYSQEFDKALQEFNLLSEKTPGSPEIILGRGMANSGNGNLDKAITDFNSVDSLLAKGKKLEDTLIARLYLSRGVCYFALDKNEAAIKDFTSCLEHNYKDPSEPMSFRGVCYGRVSDFGNCFKDLNKALELNPKNHYAVSNRGYYNSLVGDNAAALSDHTTAIALKPDDKVSYVNRGYTYLQMGQFENALDDFKMSYTLDSNYFQAVVYIGITYTNTGQYIDAIYWYDLAVELAPENPTVYYYRGTNRYNLNKMEQACEDLTKAVEMGEPNAIPLWEKNCK